ncbi:MAG: hypothetical protein P8Y07_15015 [Gemmatimonadales bacterium]
MPALLDSAEQLLDVADENELLVRRAAELVSPLSAVKLDDVAARLRLPDGIWKTPQRADDSISSITILNY